MLRLVDVSKHLGQFELSNISFDLPKGYIMGLVGQNGAGKTSIINMILGLYKLESGSIFIDGMDISEYEKMYGQKKIQDALLYAKDLKDRYSVLWVYYDLMA